MPILIAGLTTVQIERPRMRVKEYTSQADTQDASNYLNKRHLELL